MQQPPLEVVTDDEASAPEGSELEEIMPNGRRKRSLMRVMANRAFKLAVVFAVLAGGLYVLGQTSDPEVVKKGYVLAAEWCSWFAIAQLSAAILGKNAQKVIETLATNKLNK